MNKNNTTYHYTGAMLHGVNKQNVAPGELGEAVSLDLGMIPEDVMKRKICPLIEDLNAALKEYKVYVWTTISHIKKDDAGGLILDDSIPTSREENTDNEV